MVNQFRWLRRPQLFAGFLALCLLSNGFGSLIRTYTPEVRPPASVASVKGTGVQAPPAMPAVDCSAKPCMALTFDDGPDPRVTPAILDTLQRHQARATFFVIGREIPGRTGLLQRMYHEGHEIGNHSWNHADFTSLSPAAMRSEWQSTSAALVAAGLPAPTLFRPPYGAVNPAVRLHVPLTLVRWDIDTDDWLTHDPVRIMESLRRDAHPGAIILMHDKYDATALTLETALTELSPYYQFVTVSQLLGLSPGDQGQYFGR